MIDVSTMDLAPLQSCPETTHTHSVITIRLSNNQLILSSLHQEQNYALLNKPLTLYHCLADLQTRCYLHSMLSLCVENLLDNVSLTIIYNPQHKSLILFIVSFLHQPYSIILDSAPTKIDTIDYAIFTNAKKIQFSSIEIESRFKEIYVCYFATSNTIPIAKPTTLKQPNNKNNKKRLLIISYFSGPSRAVGVLRPNYWYENIPELSEQTWSVDLATATPWEHDKENIHFIPDKHMCQLLDPDNYQLKTWQSAYIDTEQDLAKHVNTQGYYWRLALEDYFRDPTYHFDAVIITGNPFLHFDFAAFAKRQWHAKVILDYRDPFANNPRYRYSTESREVARYVERGFNFQADLLCTVNDDCIPYTEGLQEKPIIVIPNGFDETKIESIHPHPLPDTQIHFVHAGAIYYDRSPDALITNLDAQHQLFHHIGRITGIQAETLNHPALKTYGQMTYPETLSIIAGADCGVVFVSSTGFETPTKVYDYIAMGIDLLICTHGPLENTALWAALKNYPGVYWCKNTPEDIAVFLNKYKKKRGDYSDSRMLYSRKTSTLKLLGHLRELLGR